MRRVLRRRPARPCLAPHGGARPQLAVPPRPPRRHQRRGERGRRRRDPHPGARRVPARGRRRASCRRPGTYATGIGFLPRDAEAETAARTGVEKIAASEGLQVLGWREVPIDNAMIGQQAADAEPSFRQVFITAAEGHPPLVGHRPRPPLLRGAQARGARARDRRRAGVLPEPLGPHPRVQGHAHARPGRAVLPRPARRAARERRSRSCTAASPPTRSRRGRSPTPTGSSPTTARSTR